MSKRSLYPISGSTEPDLRKEMERTLNGGYPEIAKGQKSILRKMRRAANGSLVKCGCVDSTTKEPDKDIFCPICHGEGNLWDESYIATYKILLRSDAGNTYKETLKPMGLNNIPLAVFYCKSDVLVTEKDRVVELVLNNEGKVLEPKTRRALYRIVTAADFRADNGRLEYWKLDCYEEKRKFLNGIGQ